MGTSPAGLQTPVGRSRNLWKLKDEEEDADWRPPETEQECMEYYQGKIAIGQSKQLLPLQEDLADWINKILGIEHINAGNIMDVLDNGVVLCHLAAVIHAKAQESVQTGIAQGPIPIIKGPFFEKASRRSFFSRDNVEKFILFCKKIGVHPNLLFETNDLVQQQNPRSVILCLMEVARIASRYAVEPPGLVVLEKEIDEEESRERNTWHFNQVHSTMKNGGVKHSSSATVLCDEVDYRREGSYIQEGGCGVGETLRRAASEGVGAGSDGAPSDTTEEEWSRESNGDDTESYREMNDLDVKVKQATKVAQKQCHCSGLKCEKLKVKKVGEGRYNIAGRNVFVRLLKGRHMMVRVGGGWDTLEHFLQRHDPCQARMVSRPSTPAGGGKTPRPYSALTSYAVHSPSHASHSLAR